jgi:hypothetical protein
MFCACTAVVNDAATMAIAVVASILFIDVSSSCVDAADRIGRTGI